MFICPECSYCKKIFANMMNKELNCNKFVEFNSKCQIYEL